VAREHPRSGPLLLVSSPFSLSHRRVLELSSAALVPGYHRGRP